jgi:hypothetical protein
MKRAILGVLVGAGLVMALVGFWDQRNEVFAQRAAPLPAATAGGDLIALPVPLGDKAQVLTIVDPRQRTVGVYHIDLSTGKITLRSVRNINWDLQMTEFNSDNPSPREVRLQLEQR